ncbi:MAG: M48 family metallopeptidase [Planctomycetes bacterium]|nr:M48 family metallopeptidase [Planctomycetota bacterium]
MSQDAAIAPAPPGGHSAEELLHSPKEAWRFCACLAFSALVYLALGAALVREAAAVSPAWLAAAAAAAAAVCLMTVIAAAFFATHVRGNGLRVSESQLPHVFAAVRHAAEVLNVRVPEIYVVQFGKRREAVVRLFVRSRILVLSSALVEDCGNGPELDMAIGAELARLRFRHLAWRAALAPAMLLPILYPAWRRATEYTADLCGLYVCRDAEAAMRTLFILAAGGRQGRKVGPVQYAAQVADAGGFWMTLRHLLSVRPALVWRASELMQAVAGPDAAAAPAPQRSVLALLLGCLVPGGAAQIRPVLGGAGGIVALLIIALLVAMVSAAAGWRAATEEQLDAPEFRYRSSVVEQPGAGWGRALPFEREQAGEDGTPARQ